MKSTNKFLFALLTVTLLFLGSTSLFSYDSTTIYTQNDYRDDYQEDYDSDFYSQNLNLSAVASLFGESRDLADLESRINDPYQKISNLDLNDDGYVDYLRLVEVTRNAIHLVVIQAVLGPDLYQDVATIEVSRNRQDHTYMQIVGDPYLYGDHYIVEPTYIYTPIIYRYFWGAREYRPYYSHYRWSHYPHYYRPWRPKPTPYYSRHVRRYINSRNHYRNTHIRRNRHAIGMHQSIRRNDFARMSQRHRADRRNQMNHKRNRNISAHNVPHARTHINRPNRQITAHKVQHRHSQQSTHQRQRQNSARKIFHSQRQRQNNRSRINTRNNPQRHTNAQRNVRTHSNKKNINRHHTRQSIQSKSLRERGDRWPQ